MQARYRFVTRPHSYFLLVAVLIELPGCSMLPDADATRSARGTVLASGSVFINELHYDNAGTDSGEAVEVAGPAGTDLSSYSVVFYNGANGQVYRTQALSGVISDAGNGVGFSTINLPVDGIQNGSPDAVALVQENVVLEFLSYEGSFTAVDGPAAGLTATDIGVAETSTTPVGFSLGRVGTGSVATSFSWAVPSASSFGAINAGQSFPLPTGTGGSGSETGGSESGGSGGGGAGAGGAASGGSAAGGTGTPTPFVNEFHYDNTGTDSGEAVEIAGPAGLDLSAYTVVFYNGSNGLVYRTEALSGVISDEGSGFGTFVLNLPVDGIQNGSPDAIALVRDSEVIEFLSYEGSLTAVDGPAAGLTAADIGVSETSSTPIGSSLQRTGSGLIAADFVWSGPSVASLGVVNSGQVLAPGGGTGGSSGGAGGAGGSTGGGADAGGTPACGMPSTAISAVQGRGDVSPLVGQSVSVEGIVVGDFQGPGENLGGLFVQSETPDSDPLTSEGLFIFDQNLAGSPALSLGDRIRVTGSVSEYFGLTELTASSIESCGTLALPAPVPLSFPLPSASYLETLEGMLVRVSELTVTETFNLGRYGEISLSAGGRLFNPGAGTGATPTSNLLRRILLDDGRDAQNLSVPYLAPDGTLRIGDTSNTFDAILSYGFDFYRLEPLDRSAVAFSRTNPRPLSPSDVGGDVRIASLNVLNYFTTLNDRGADTSEEFSRQQAKLVSAIVGLNADVLGLMEVENNDTSGNPVALESLVAAVNSALGAPVYAHAPDPNFTGTDRIRTALLYKPSRVSSLGLAASSTNTVFSRPPIAETFSYRGNRFTVIVNHFKSKGSCPSSASDPNSDFGQGCWNQLRTEQAQALLSFIDEQKAASGDPDVVLLGDYNSYLAEDPIRVLEASGLVNQERLLSEADRYSYVFNGESGTLDYAFTTPSLAVVGRAVWHVNSDEPIILDYNTEFNPPGLFAPNAFRSSDHDPVLIGLALPADQNVLYSDLKTLTKNAPLSSARKLVLMAALELSQAAAKLAVDLDPKSAKLAEAARKVARRQIAEYVAQVNRYVQQGHLSAASAAPLRAGAQEVNASLSAP